MPEETQTVSLTLTLDYGPNASSDYIDDMTRSLRDEINDSDLASASLVRGHTIEEGAMSDGVVTIGQLALAVLPGASTALIAFWSSWKLRTNAQIKEVSYKKKDGTEITVKVPRDMSSAEVAAFLNAVIAEANEK